MSVRAALSMLLAWTVPGAGHLFLGRRGRALIFFVVIVLLFLIGVSIDGGLYTFASSRGSWLKMLASLGSMGSGLLYFVAKRFGVPGDVISATFEYGSTFTLTAGLMNLLLVLDCYDISRGVKQ
ncbi:MAG TPA: DUF6677 family protein [Thermoanaerobaculia bacterium]|nr:DUF6677 family protein [Thermoanaerobaculia bacterium]